MAIKIALAMIVKGSPSEAILLDDCLSNVSPHVDGLFITVTQPCQEVEDVVKKYNGVLSHFEWCYDFAKARNYNFSQVPKEYTHILWCDADDNFRNLNLLKKVIAGHPFADAFSMNYLYHFNEYKQPDVVHIKTMVVKNDGCVEWAGKLHEDFKENRQISRFFIKDIERIHLTNEERIIEAKERNVEVALKDMLDNPDDPRSYWNLGNACFGAGKYADARKHFEKFLTISKSEEEKYIVYIYLSKLLEQLNDFSKSIEYGRMAIGLRPEYPDAYNSLAQIQYNRNNFKEAESLLVQGLVKKPPYYSIIVFNPRDYDFTPLMLLAKTYYSLSRPDQAIICLKGCLKIQPQNTQVKEMLKLLEVENKKFTDVLNIAKRASKLKTKSAIKKLLDSVPVDLQSHPAICALRNTHFVKETSSGKDIVYYCGYTAEEWTPETARTKGIGGSEEAVIWLTKMWKEEGYNVTVYNNCGHKTQVFDGVIYKPYWEWNYRDKQDVVIIWRNPLVLQYKVNAPKVILDLHDVIPAQELTEERLKNVDKIFVKSQYQRELFKHVPDEKFVVVPNGIDSELFSVETKRDNNLIINTSAPNRGIYALTHMFREIKKQHPEARLQWAYGWNTFNNGFKDDPEVLKWAEQLRKDMDEIGVESLGRISHGEVAQLYLKAGIWAYPSGFGEIDCISLSKAMAAGAFPVTTDFAALGEKQGHGGHFIHSDVTSNNWLKPNQHDFSIIDQKQIDESIKAIVYYLKNPPSEESRKEMRKWAQEKFDWRSIKEVWLKEMV